MRKNAEGYSDPTVNNAFVSIDSEERFHKLIHAIFHICDLAGFRVDGRITLVDLKTGRVWK